MTDTNEKIEPPPGMSPEATRWVAGRVVPFLRAQAVAAGLAVDDEATPWQWVNGADPVDLLHAMVAAGLVVGVQPATRAAAPPGGEMVEPPTLDDGTYAAVAAALAPYRGFLFGCRPPAGGYVPVFDVHMPARKVVDALHAAGVLVFDGDDDRAHLRASWAAMSTALIQLSARREVDVDVIQAVPVAHRGYLQGHAATYRQLAELWERIEAATELVAALSVPGVDDEPTYGTRGQLVAVLDILRGAEQTIAVQRRDTVAKMVTQAPLVDLAICPDQDGPIR